MEREATYDVTPRVSSPPPAAHGQEGRLDSGELGADGGMGITRMATDAQQGKRRDRAAARAEFFREKPPRWWEVRWLIRFAVELLVLICLSAFISGTYLHSRGLEASVAAQAEVYRADQEAQRSRDLITAATLARIEGRQAAQGAAQIRLLDDVHHLLQWQSGLAITNTRRIDATLRRVRRIPTRK